MALKLKRLLVPFLLVSSFITLLTNCEFLHPQPDSVNLPPPKEEVKAPKREGAITHKNCLFKCPLGTASDNIIVDHDAILLSSNRKTKFADWVAYKITSSYINGPERKRNWAKDPKIDVQFTFTPQDYKGMSQEPYNFDRGHQAPLASFKNHPKWHVVNYLSNITPQKKDLNRGPWKNLESAERKLVKQHEEAYVLTGPYYDKANIIKGPPIKRLKYVIPSGYWKVIAIRNGSDIKAAGFIFPQNVPPKDNYCRYLVNIPAIEKRTGLKFFDGKVLPQEATLKNEIGCWQDMKRVPVPIH